MLLIEAGYSGRVLGIKKVTTKIRQALVLETGVFIDALENNLEDTDSDYISFSVLSLNYSKSQPDTLSAFCFKASQLLY